MYGREHVVGYRAHILAKRAQGPVIVYVILVPMVYLSVIRYASLPPSFLEDPENRGIGGLAGNSSQGAQQTSSFGGWLATGTCGPLPHLDVPQTRTKVHVVPIIAPA